MRRTAEGMSRGSFAYQVRDGSAGDGSALRWEGDGTATRRVSLSGPVEQVVVRSRNATASTGAVTISVFVDGVRQGSRTIAEGSTAYQDRAWDVEVPQGTHTIAVRGGGLAGEDRMLADRVRLRGTKAPAPDGDRDGVPDASDNCPSVTNESQRDADGDGLGDACEGTQDEPASPPPTDGCDRTASPGSGTLEGATNAADGQTVCLRAGVYTAPDSVHDITNNRLTLTGYPGGARPEVRGRVDIAPTGNDVTLRGVRILGHFGSSKANPGHAGDTNTGMAFQTNAANTLVEDSEITNRDPGGNPDRAGTCVHFGGSGAPDAVNPVLRNSTIHHCGRVPRTNYEHGVYAGHAQGGVIEDNLIWGIANRGLQLYPNVDNMTVRGNIVSGGSHSHNFEGSGSTAASQSTNNTAWGNVYVSPESYTLYGVWQGSVPNPHNNVARDNCVWENGTSGINVSGFASTGNATVDPRFDSSLDDGAVKVTNPTCAAKLPAGSRFRP